MTTKQKKVNEQTTATATANTLDMSNVTAQLSTALSIDRNAYFEQIEKSDGTVTELSKKVYQLQNPVGKRTQITVYDISVIESMEKINAALKGRNILSYVICKELANIALSGKLESMGFKTIAEFGKAIYGFETSTSNHYARIGVAFLNDDYTVKAGLPQLSVSHFIELNTLVAEDGNIDTIIDLYTSGQLVDGMSTKKMRDVIKAIKNGTTLEDKSATASNEESEQTATATATASNSEQTASEPTVHDIEQNFDSNIAIGQILNKCSDIEQLFNILNKNGIEVVGFEDAIKTIKALAKTLVK